MKEQYELIVGTRHTGIGYALLALSESHNFDEIKVVCSKYNLQDAEVAVLVLSLNGWHEVHNSRNIEKAEISTCRNCGEIIKKIVDLCPKCKGDCKRKVFDNMVIRMQKIGSLQAHQEEILTKKKYKQMLEFLEMKKKEQKMKDSIILDRWCRKDELVESR